MRSLLKLGFKRLKSDPCIMVHKSRGVMVGIYVDDTIIAYRNISQYDKLVADLKKEYELRHSSDVEECLGMAIKRQPDGSYTVNQRKYIEGLLSK